MKQLIARIDDDLHAQFKAACALDGENMTALIERWIREFVETRNALKHAESQAIPTQGHDTENAV